MVYIECIPDGAYSSMSKQTAAYSCKRLGMPLVELRFFRPTKAEPVRNGRQKGQPWKDSTYLKGVCTQRLLSGKADVWIRDGLHANDLIVTIAHEIFHLYEYKNDLATNEQKAELFGRQVLSELAIQSQMIYYSFM